MGPVHSLGPDLQPVRTQPRGAEEQLDEQLQQRREPRTARDGRHCANGLLSPPPKPGGEKEMMAAANRLVERANYELIPFELNTAAF